MTAPAPDGRTDSPIPVCDLRRHTERLSGRLAEALLRVAASGWFVLGRETEAFESMFARFCGSRHAIGVGNGTDAIELALRAAGVGPGDLVVTAANAGGYATTAIRAAGARPLYVDVDPRTLLMTAAGVRGVLAQRPRAVVATHLYGRMCDIASIVDAAAGVAVIEDCAQAHGASRDGRRAGSIGLAGCFSFYPTKNLGALGDGGAVVTGDVAIADAVRSLRQYGWSSKYVAARPGGRNSRLDELQAAVLAAKLPLLDGWNARRRGIARRYSDGIDHPAICVAPPGGDEFVAHLYVVRTPAREALRAHLAGRGIGTDVHYPIPDHRQPAWAGDGARVALPETEAAAGEALTLPCFPELADGEVDRVIEACNDWRA
jgi:dTDP-3-amino-2,3,6-trideoxy-4-keto-D-glucose/dTDP-3-amino-3,4,6-trideoxy-alpha-D-glucose/dTDP-2,6-dideoxy-D-kanosamine transaminase